MPDFSFYDAGKIDMGPDSFYAKILASLRNKYGNNPDVKDEDLQEAARMTASGGNMIYRSPSYTTSGQFELAGLPSESYNFEYADRLVPQLVKDRMSAKSASNQREVSSAVKPAISNMQSMIADREAMRDKAFKDYQRGSRVDYQKAGEQRFGPDFNMYANYKMPGSKSGKSFLTSWMYPENPNQAQLDYQSEYKEPSYAEFMQNTNYQDDELQQYMQGLKNLMRFQ